MSLYVSFDEDTAMTAGLPVRLMTKPLYDYHRSCDCSDDARVTLVSRYCVPASVIALRVRNSKFDWRDYPALGVSSV